MADPIFIDIPEGKVWTLVASNVTTGQIHKAILTPDYFHSYRDTGNPPPPSNEIGIPILNISAKICAPASSPIDVYIQCPTKEGRVRVDL